MPNNLKFCDYASPSLGWYAPGGTFVGNDAGLVAGKAYLNCGKWYVPNWTSDLSCVGAGFPRANCPFAASQANPYNFPGSDDPTWDDAAIDVTNSTSSKDTCADIGKQTVNEANYAALSTVYTNTNQGDLVNGKGMLAIVTDAVMARLEVTPSVWNPSGYSKAGFTFGWLDGDNTTGFRIPNVENKQEYVQLGMRMWNVTNSGGAGSLSGWVMPMRVQMNCYSTGNSGRYIRFTVEMPANAKDRWGMKCSRGGDTVSGQYQVCTIPDGSQYTIALKKRDLQLNPSIEITANTQ